MNGVYIDTVALLEWETSGVVRDYADTTLRAVYRSLLERLERNGWLPEPEATMFASYGAELSRRALLAQSDKAEFAAALGGC